MPTVSHFYAKNPRVTWDLVMIGFNYHFVKWQLHPISIDGAIYNRVRLKNKQTNNRKGDKKSRELTEIEPWDERKSQELEVKA